MLLQLYLRNRIHVNRIIVYNTMLALLPLFTVISGLDAVKVR